MEHKEEKTFNQNSKKKEEPPQNKDRLRSLWDKFKHNNIHIIGMLEREQKEQKIKKLFEKLMKENSPNLVKEIDIQVQEAQRVPNKMTLRMGPKTNVFFLLNYPFPCNDVPTPEQKKNGG